MQNKMKVNEGQAKLKKKTKKKLIKNKIRK